MPRRRDDKENAKLSDEERHILGGIRQQASRIRPQSIKALVNRLISERGYAAVQGKRFAKLGKRLLGRNWLGKLPQE